MTQKEHASFVQRAALNGVREWQHRDNGLRVLTCPTPVAPVVTVGAVYMVGSRNESSGMTGAAHITEHLVFKATESFNPETGNDMAQALQLVGARFNATTWLDRTIYYATLPVEHISLALQIEADRMRSAIIRDEDLESERSVILNELERCESEPADLIMKESFAHAFIEHPYHHPTIGWRNDVESISADQLRKFYDTFYYPDNAALIITGDVVEESMLDLVDSYFGQLSPAPLAIPKVLTRESKQRGERRFKLCRSGELGLLTMVWHTACALHPDMPALSVLSQVLGAGVTSRLYQKLVETNLCLSVHAISLELHDPGLFQVSATLAPEVAHAAVEEIVRQEVQALQQTPPTPQEMSRALVQVRSELAFQRASPTQIMSGLGEATAAGDWRRFAREMELVAAVTAEDLQRVAAKYLQGSSMTVGWFIPENDSETVQLSDHAGESTAASDLAESGELATATSGEDEQQLQPPVMTDGDGKARQGSLRSSFSSRVRIYDFDSGGRLSVLTNPHAPTVTLAGSMQAGLSQVLTGRYTTASMTSFMLERGTANHDRLQLAQVLEDHGLQITSETSTHAPSTLFLSAHGLADELPRLLSLLVEIISTPTFPPDELDKLKDQIVGGLMREKNETFSQAFAALSRHIYPAGYPLHIRPVDVRIEEVESLTCEELREFHERTYRPDTLQLAVVGDVDPDQVFALLSEQLEGWQYRPGRVHQLSEPEVAAGGKELINIPDRPNLDVLLGHHGNIRRGDPRYAAAALANACLGYSTLTSRLGKAMREREGLTYGIFSRFFGTLVVPGPWLAYFSVSRENLERAIDMTRSIIGEYVETGPDMEELDDERESLAGAYRVAMASNGGVARELASTMISGQPVSYLDSYPDQLRKVSRDEVIEVLQESIRPRDLTLVVAGTLDEPSNI
jgi:zinc protease